MLSSLDDRLFRLHRDCSPSAVEHDEAASSGRCTSCGLVWPGNGRRPYLPARYDADQQRVNEARWA